MKYSLCLTNYNRTTLLFESYAKVFEDERIDEIIISDDNSDFEKYVIVELCTKPFYPKIKHFRNSENLGMLENKKKSLSFAKNDLCILFDSDNILTPSYLDAMDKLLEYEPLDEWTIYQPDFLKPKFDYTMFSGCEYNLKTIQQLFTHPMGSCVINSCNYIINKNHYAVPDNPNAKAADSVWILLHLLKAGYKIKIVPNMQYEHRQFEDSGFMQDLSYNMAMAENIKQLLIMESDIANNKK